MTNRNLLERPFCYIPLKTNVFTMLKKRVGPLEGARRAFLCCCERDPEVASDSGSATTSRCFHRTNCCYPCPDKLDRISNTSKASRADKTAKTAGDKFADAVCLIRDSPFRILRVSIYFLKIISLRLLVRKSGVFINWNESLHKILLYKI